MAQARAWLEVAFVLGILGVLPQPAVAQSQFAFGAVHEYIAAAHLLSEEEASLPPNLMATPVYRDVLASMTRRSPTFRRQCQRIGGENRLTVILQPASPAGLLGNRAITHIVRQPSGSLSATIGISPLENQVELIAHELEHIIEQLDEVDLASRAALPNTGVRAIDTSRNLFETARATEVGLRVAQECRAVDRHAD
jgi:hypothetical protein